MLDRHTDFDSSDIIHRISPRAKRLKISLLPDNTVQVTRPSYVSLSAARRFVLEHTQWIIENRGPTLSLLVEGAVIGRTHTLHFVEGESLKSRVQDNKVVIRVPRSLDIENPRVQAEAKKAAIRAVTVQAQDVLPSILHTIARVTGHKYTQVHIKKMRSRWGSCSTQGIINLSVWLIQLPDELINYVCAHELTHLTHHNHSKQFWDALETIDPDYKQHRQMLKSYRTALMPR